MQTSALDPARIHGRTVRHEHTITCSRRAQ